MKLEEYRKLSEVEDRMWYFRALNRRMAHWLGRLLPAGESRILDAGCGTGGLIRSLQGTVSNWRLTGLDFMPLACELARLRTQAEIVEGSITSLPFAAETFDAVVSADVLCQVEAHEVAAREFWRVLRPGGIMLVNVPAYRWLWSYHDDSCQTKRRYTRAELLAVFRSAGFEVIWSSYANFLPLPLIAARRKVFRPADPTSDVQLYAGPVEAGFSALAAVEFAWQRAGLASPAGSSVFLAARRP